MFIIYQRDGWIIDMSDLFARCGRGFSFGEAISGRTTTLLPLAYVILLPLALNLTETPRVVVGTGGYRADFLNDILVPDGKDQGDQHCPKVSEAPTPRSYLSVRCPVFHFDHKLTP